MATQTQEKEVPHSRYTPTNKKAYSSQADVAKAWAEDMYPTHNVDFRGNATLYSSENFKGVQREDGSGVLRHYRTREAIRTRNGLIIDNMQCWSRGFAHCTSPPGVDARLPLSAVEEHIDDQHDIFDIRRLITDDGYRKWSVAHFGEYGVALGYDPSGAFHNRYFTLRLTEDEVSWAAETSVKAVVTHVLTPDGIDPDDVVDSAEYAKTRLSEEEREAHVNAGGHLSESPSSWYDRRINLQHFRADLQGTVVVRQGEWFFLPTDYEPSDHDLRRVPSAPLGDHRASRANGFAKDSDGNLYAQGEIYHRTGDHDSVNLGDTWHRAVTHDRNVTVADTSSGHGTVRYD